MLIENHGGCKHYLIRFLSEKPQHQEWNRVFWVLDSLLKWVFSTCNSICQKIIENNQKKLYPMNTIPGIPHECMYRLRPSLRYTWVAWRHDKQSNWSSNYTPSTSLSVSPISLRVVVHPPLKVSHAKPVGNWYDDVIKSSDIKVGCWPNDAENR